MKIQIPAEEALPTRGAEAASSGTKKELEDFAKGMERKYERLKLVHDNMLNDKVYAPLLLAHEFSDEELKEMILEAGWVVNFDSQFGSDEERSMWLNRFRRFAAAVVQATKEGK